MVSLPILLLMTWLLFIIGVMGLLTRRSAFQMLLSLFFMLQAGCLAWLGLVKLHQVATSSFFALFLLFLMSVQFLVGLAVMVRSLLYHHSLDVTKQSYLRH